MKNSDFSVPEQGLSQFFSCFFRLNFFSIKIFSPVFMTTAFLIFSGCGIEDIWNAEEWNATVSSTEDTVFISVTIADVPDNFIHVSIRKEGYESGYTIERSPAPRQPERDWSRVHHWFMDMHPNTYMEGRFDDGRGRGPSSFTTYHYELPRGVDMERENFPDTGGSDYVYITRGYSYADGNYRHPLFEPGNYEIEIYAWFTGKATETHPSIDGREGVQYIHYDYPLTSTEFVLE